jgi:alkyl sulfatase BDS1-like metallo-beta-lactamase superfamily hydrolase
VYQIRGFDISNMTLIEGDAAALVDLFGLLDDFPLMFTVLEP